MIAGEPRVVSWRRGLVRPRTRMDLQAAPDAASRLTGVAACGVVPVLFFETFF